VTDGHGLLLLVGGGELRCHVPVALVVVVGDDVLGVQAVDNEQVEGAVFRGVGVNAVTLQAANTSFGMMVVAFLVGKSGPVLAVVSWAMLAGYCATFGSLVVSVSSVTM